MDRVLSGLRARRDRVLSGLKSRGERVVSRLPPPLRAAWGVAERTVRDSLRDRLPGLAAETALFTLLSLPSLLLVMLGSLGYLADALGPQGRAELDRLVFEVPKAFLSPQTYSSYEGVARSILDEGRADVISVGVVISLWTGSRAMNRYLETVTIAYDIDDARPVWRRRLLALGLTVAGLVAAIALLPALVVGPEIVEWLAPASVAQTTLAVASLFFWPGMGLLALLALASLYHFGVPGRTPWRRDLPGAVLALVLWLLSAVGMRIYIAVSVQGDGVYGQLATPIAVVLWLYVTAFAVLLGAEFNAEIEKTWPHERYPWRLRNLRHRWQSSRG